MTTPICDFVRDYIADKTIRMHMPGHKGSTVPEDITEISGADVLYHSEGIIRESEENAAQLFGSVRTVYSCEGSSLCIRAMLHLARLYAIERNIPFRVLAGRNAHKTFLYAAAVTEPEVEWIFSKPEDGLLRCTCDPEVLDRQLNEKQFACVYITSPDYTGHMNDIRAIADVCHRHGTLLIVDNAHGAYLRFLPGALHPMDAGADMCCDSAHKTLPVVTGGAYLHIGKNAPEMLSEWVEDACAMYASTSPSYLIMQSIDSANAIINSDSWRAALLQTIKRIETLKEALIRHGYKMEGNEPMKIALASGGYGYSGMEIADHLRTHGIECEYADPDRVVLMPSPSTTSAEFDLVLAALTDFPKRTPIVSDPPQRPTSKYACSIRTAMLSARERLAARESLGRILADACVSCPPAVPILIPGEVITAEAVLCFEYYGIDRLIVMK